jgi:hypothetical protein
MKSYDESFAYRQHFWAYILAGLIAGGILVGLYGGSATLHWVLADIEIENLLAEGEFDEDDSICTYSQSILLSFIAP